jgi:hypothetical protein
LTNAGAIKTFKRTGASWADLGYSLVPGYSHGRLTNDRFGQAVKVLNGNTLMIAAPYQDYSLNGATNFTDMGAIFKFTFDGVANKFVFNRKIARDVANEQIAINGMKVLGINTLMTVNNAATHFWTMNEDGTLTYNNTVAFTSSVVPMNVTGTLLARGDTSVSTGTNGQPTITAAGGVRLLVNGVEDTTKLLTVPGSSNGRNTYDNFGGSVAITNDYIAIGASGHAYSEIGLARTAATGAVFIFSKPLGSSNYRFERKIVSSLNTGNNIGYKVIAKGNYLYSGNCLYSSNKGYGEVWYRASAGNWSLQNSITGTGTGKMGMSVALLTDAMLVLGNPLGNGSNVTGAVQLTECGEFRTITRSGTTWTDRGYKIVEGWVNTKGDASSAFGYSLAANKDFLVVGAPYQDFKADGSTSTSNAGAVFIFRREESSYAFVGRYTSQTMTANATFGAKVAIDDRSTYIAVSAPAINAVHVFTWDGANLTEMTKLTGISGEQFGASIAVNKDFIAVGAPANTTDAVGANTLTGAGAVYVYSIVNGSSAVLNEKVVAYGDDGRVANAAFGSCVAITGRVLLIGAPGHTSYEDGLVSAGAVYLRIIGNRGPNWVTTTMNTALTGLPVNIQLDSY